MNASLNFDSLSAVDLNNDAQFTPDIDAAVHYRSFNRSISSALLVNNTMSVQGDENSTASEHSEFLISGKTAKKLDKFSKCEPLTYPFSRIKGYPRYKATDPENAILMPKMYMGACWGGSALKSGACRHIKNIDNGDSLTILSTVADAYLLARRQITINALLSISKLATLAALSALSPYISPLLAFTVAPIEGTIDALQTRRLMRKILEENHIECSLIDKVNFFKLGLGSHKNQKEITPMRNGLGTVAIPKNTKKTRTHLEKLLPDNECLKTILDDRANYIALKHWASTNGGVLKEEAWRKILGLIIESGNRSGLG